MARFVLTGASGYIGKRLLALALARGHEVVVLGRTAPGMGEIFYPWALGEEAPAEALRGAQAVLHLAHSWHIAVGEAANVNLGASTLLALQTLAACVPRFVFASSVSARPGALNVYGRVKYAIEGLLEALPGSKGRVVSARIALVYGGAPAGQYALMRAITRMTPVLPMVGLDRQVQPIHLDEVCAALLTLAQDNSLDAPHYVVAGAPMPFGRWLKILRRVQSGGGLLMIPLPLAPMLLACDLTRYIPFLPTIDRERVLGLAASSPMDSGESLEALGLVPGDPLTLLLREEEQHEPGEAQALLRYLGGRAVTSAMTQDLAQGLARAGLSPLGLSRFLIRHPAAIALVEPPANNHANRLARALHLASQVLEAHGAAAPRRSIFGAGLLVALDLLVLPLRLITARRYR